jgi:hypothetical protein
MGVLRRAFTPQPPRKASQAAAPAASRGRPQTFRATLTLPDGTSMICCQTGHASASGAEAHGKQIAAALESAFASHGVQKSHPVTSGAVILGGLETLTVVGELHFQGNLWELVGGRGDPEERVRQEIIAVLHPEDDNPVDVNAISVWVSTEEDREHTLQAGHLSRDDARRYRPGLIAKMEELGRPVALRGAISGGGMREDGPGRLGVFLDHEPADFGLRY